MKKNLFYFIFSENSKFLIKNTILSYIHPIKSPNICCLPCTLVGKINCVYAPEFKIVCMPMNSKLCVCP